MFASASLLLKLALALLIAIQGNTTADPATITQAFTTADQAIQLANSVLAGNSTSIITSLASSTPPVALPLAPIASASIAPISLVVTKNTALEDKTITSSSTNILIGSYDLTNNSSSTIKLTSFIIKTGPNMNYVQNFRIKSGGDIGFTKLFVGDNAPYAFDGELTISGGSTKTVDVYADFSPAVNGSMFPATTFVSCVGKVLDTDAPISCPSAPGQKLTVEPPRAALTATLNSDSAGFYVLPGSSAVEIGSFKLTASPVGDISLTGVTLITGAGINNMQNLIVKVNNSSVSMAQLSVLPNSYYTYSFSAPVTVAAGNYQTLDVYADVLPSATGTVPTAISLADCTGKTSQLLLNIPCNTVAGQNLAILPLSSAFTITANPDLADRTVSASSTAVRIGSYKISASAASAVNFASFTVQTGSNMVYLQNLVLKIAGNQFGTTQSALANMANYVFTGATAIPAGGPQVIDLYADIPAGINTAIKAATTISTCTGTLAQTGKNISCPSTPGQSVIIN